MEPNTNMSFFRKAFRTLVVAAIFCGLVALNAAYLEPPDPDMELLGCVCSCICLSCAILIWRIDPRRKKPIKNVEFPGMFILIAALLNILLMFVHMLVMILYCTPYQVMLAGLAELAALGLGWLGGTFIVNAKSYQLTERYWIVAIALAVFRWLDWRFVEPDDIFVLLTNILVGGFAGFGLVYLLSAEPISAEMSE